MSIDSREKSIYLGSPYECFWFTCGAQSWRFTSGDVDRTVSGFLYTRETIDRTEIDQNQEARSGSITVRIPVDNPVAELFRNKLAPRPVSLVIFRGQSGESEVGTNYNGMVSSVKFTTVCELTVVIESDNLKHATPSLVYQTQCPRDVFSAGCELVRQEWEVLAKLTEVNGLVIKSDTFADYPDAYFNGGWLEWNGSTASIVGHEGTSLYLFFPVDGLTATQDVLVYPGCPGTEAACAGKFNNIANHLGFSRIPNKNPFGQGGIA